MNKENLFKIIFLVSFWVVVVLFISFYDRTILLHDPVLADVALSPEYDFYSILLSSLIATITGGIFIASIEVFYFSRLLRRKPFGLSLLIKSIFYLLNIIFFTSMSTLIGASLQLDKPIFHEVVWTRYISVLSSPRLWFVWLFWGFTVILALFILAVSEKLGQGVLLNYLLGRYHRPREEVRIFMFLDLKSSTTIAEKLGHITYSMLIQDCFYDLTHVVAKREAQIYQYVGDEIVLTWEMQKGLRNGNCLHTYYEYEEVLMQKQEDYLKKFGLVPTFKAGLDSGLVTVAEVGEIKKELAYHGDVLNTASRIQDMCNPYHSSVLLSERLKEQFHDDPEKGFEFIGDLKLRGKQEGMKVYSYAGPE